MAKKLLLNYLVNVLGEFIDLNEENLNLGVWSGQIILNDLNLKTDKFLREFEFNVVRGEIKSLEITIPWTSLMSSPIKIKISGISLQVGPTDIAAVDKGKALKKSLQEKMENIANIEKYAELTSSLQFSSSFDAADSGDSESGSETYLQQWTSKIIDSIEIELSDIHFRYEDNLTIPGKVFAVGMTLESLRISTCDAKWHISGRAAASARDSSGAGESSALGEPGGNKKGGSTASSSSNVAVESASVNTAAVHKMLVLKCLGLYWQSEGAKPFATLPVAKWHDEMAKLVYKDGSSKLKEIQYIMSPAGNYLEAKLTHNKKHQIGKSKFNLDVHSTKLDLRLNSSQYRQLCHTLDRSSAIVRFRQPSLFTPRERPTHSTGFARAWWKYGVRLVIKRRRYIHLIKQTKMLQWEGEECKVVASSDHSLSSKKRALFKKELSILEERLPLLSLKIFHQMAINAMIEDHKEKVRKENAEAAANGWWGGWLGNTTGTSGDLYATGPGASKAYAGAGTKSGGGADTAGNDDISIDSIMETFKSQDSLRNSSSNQPFSITCSLKGASSLEIVSGTTAILRFTMALGLSCNINAEGINFRCELRELSIIDQYTQQAFLSNIVAVKNATTTKTNGTASSSVSNALKSSSSSKGLPSSSGGAGGTAIDTSTSIYFEDMPTLLVCFDSSQGKSAMKVSALPIELSLNKDCIQRLLSEFVRPPNRYAFIRKQQKMAERREALRRAERAAQKGIVGGASGSAASVAAAALMGPAKTGGVMKSAYTRLLTAASSGLEISFEAYAPKIIIPRCCSGEVEPAEQGYLLLDSGYLVLKGFVGATGMNMEISLSNINAALPLHVREMNAIEEHSLYLIKPFDIEMNVQSVDKSTADMTVQVNIKPGIRGEIDPIKLARLLGTINEVTEMFTVKLPVLDNSMFGTISAANMAAMNAMQAAAAASAATASTASLADSATAAPLTIGTPSVVTNKSTNLGGRIDRTASVDTDNTEATFTNALPRHANAAQSTTAQHPQHAAPHHISEQQQQQQQQSAEEDAYHTFMQVTVNMPVLAIDLTYDVENRYHAEFIIDDLSTLIVNRTFDRQTTIDMKNLSIHDSYRAPSQKELLFTPVDDSDNSIVHIVLNAIHSLESPLYNGYGSETIAEFAQLCLNVDTKTVNHLKPFMEVLLAPKAPVAEVTVAAAAGSGGALKPAAGGRLSRTHSSSASGLGGGSTGGVSRSTSADSLSAAAHHQQQQASASESNPMLDPITGKPNGTRIFATMRKMTLDMMRTPTTDRIGQELDKTYALAITNFVMDIKMREFMNAEVKLRSFEIFDERKSSANFVYRKIFCPVLAAGEQSFLSEAEKRAMLQEVNRGGMSSNSSEECSDLLNISYSQEKSNSAFMEVTVSDIVMFVSVNTILDLAYVASENWGALVGLFAAPQSQAQPQSHTLINSRDGSDLDLKSPPPSHSPAPFIEEDGGAESPQQSRFQYQSQQQQQQQQGQHFELPIKTSSSNIAVKVNTPRLILLEDPTSAESQAIVGRNHLEVHYTRQFDYFASREAPDCYESLHVTVFQNELFALRNMKHFIPQSILSPMDIEFHLKKKTVNEQMSLLHLQVDMEKIDARLTFNDLLLAQAIMAHYTQSNTAAQEEQEGEDEAGDTLSSPSGVATTTTGLTRRDTSAGKDMTPKKLEAAAAAALAREQLQTEQKKREAANLAASKDPSLGELTFSFELRSLDFVVVNDFNNQSQPIAKILMNDIRLYFDRECNGRPLVGDGSIAVMIDVHNPLLGVWEPMLDNWNPSLRIENGPEGNIIDVKSQHTMQWSLSGAMLETLLRSYSLFQHDTRSSSVEFFEKERALFSDVVINNLLGDGVGVELYDTATKTKMLTLIEEEGMPSGADSDFDDDENDDDGDNNDDTFGIVDTSGLDSPTNTPVRTLQQKQRLKEKRDHKRVSDSRVAASCVGKLKGANLPLAVDVHLTGRLMYERKPILHLPFKMHKPKAFKLAPTKLYISALKMKLQGNTANSFKAVGTSSMPVMAVEPVVEEVYENCRYEIISGRWREPYLLKDRAGMSDITGAHKRDIQSVEVEVGWEWIGEWQIDKHGVVGEEIDSEGWEYASAFSQFTSVSKRRTRRSMDSVRRRRWTRARVPVMSQSPSQHASAAAGGGAGAAGGAGAEQFSAPEAEGGSGGNLLNRNAPHNNMVLYPPLILFWHARTAENGSRVIDIRSDFQITNNLAYDVYICLRCKSWGKHQTELGPIAAGSVYSVPLLHAGASWMRIRPAGVSSSGTNTGSGSNSSSTCIQYAWSANSYPVSRLHYNYSVTKDVLCLPKESPYSLSSSSNTMAQATPRSTAKSGSSSSSSSSSRIKNGSASSESSACMRLTLTEVDGSLMVSLTPYIVLQNSLLCDVQFACACTDGRNEEAAVLSGESHKFSMVNLSFKPKMRIKIGRYEWSAPVSINHKEFTVELEMFLPGTVTSASTSAGRSASQRRGLVVTLGCKVTEEQSVLLTLFSSGLLIDYTGLDLYILSQERVGVDIIRGTCLESSTSALSVVDMITPFGGDSAALSNTSSGGGMAPSAAATAIASAMAEPSGGGVLSKFKVIASCKKYSIRRGRLGGSVYSDRAVRWTHLPSVFVDHLQIRTPYADRYIRAGEVLQFTVACSSIVFVLVDIKCAKLPSWMIHQQYKITEEMAVGARVFDNVLEEYQFAVYGKHYAAGEEVSIGGNWMVQQTTNIMHTMFVVPVYCLLTGTKPQLYTASGEKLPNSVPSDNTPLEVADAAAASNVSNNSRRGGSSSSSPQSAAEQIEHAVAVSAGRILVDTVLLSPSEWKAKAQLGWVEGANSLTMFQAVDNTVSLGVHSGAAWSERFSIDASKKSTVSYSATEVHCPDTGTTYQLSYKIDSLPGPYAETSVLTVMPCYCILNCTDENIYISQMGSMKACKYSPYKPQGWHKDDNAMQMGGSTSVQFSTASSEWSLGSVDINEIGTTVLFVPRKASSSAGATSNNSSSSSAGGIVLHVEVKLAGPNDRCAIVVVVWKEALPTVASMCIINETDVPITVKQSDIELHHEILDNRISFELTVPPNSTAPFGWADAEMGSLVLVGVGTALGSDPQKQRVATIDLNALGHGLRLPYRYTAMNAVEKRGEVIVSVIRRRGGHSLLVTRLDKMRATHHLLSGADSNKSGKNTKSMSTKIAGRVGGSDDQLSADDLAAEAAAQHEEQEAAKAAAALGPKFGLNFMISSFGLSVIANKPVTRELFSLYIDGLEMFMETRGNTKFIDFEVMDLQIDNYSETNIYPVLLYSKKKNLHRSVYVDNRSRKRAETIENMQGSNAESFTSSRSSSNTTASAGNLSNGGSIPAGASTYLIDVGSGAKFTSAAENEVPLIKFALILVTERADMARGSVSKDISATEGSSTSSTGVAAAAANKQKIDLHSMAETTTSIQYFGFRMLHLVLEVDSATVQIFMSDFLDSLRTLSTSHALATSVPAMWADQFNIDTVSSRHKYHLLDVYQTKMQSQGAKMHVKNFVVHPIKMTITFTQVPFPRRSGAGETLQSTLLQAALALVGIEKLPLRLKSFVLEDTTESYFSLKDLLVSKLTQDIVAQYPRIAGSLQMFGSPIGLFRRVGKGVKAFFYEPYLGAVNSPQDMVLGIGRGTHGLISGVVSGTLGSAVGIVGTAAKGFAHLSGDTEYVRDRALRQQQAATDRGGLLVGIKDGGESVVTGITSGLGGLISKPIEEASKGGISGFIRGIGLGIVGAAVKPILGIADAATSLAAGISQEVDNTVRCSAVRPPRVLEPSSLHPSERVIVPLNLEAAFAQEFIAKRAKQYKYEDTFLRYIPIGESVATSAAGTYTSSSTRSGTSVKHTSHSSSSSRSNSTAGECLILSTTYIFWKSAASLWGRVWSNVSHCALLVETHEVAICLYNKGAAQQRNNNSRSRSSSSSSSSNNKNSAGFSSYKDGEWRFSAVSSDVGEVVFIPCGSAAQAAKVFYALSQYESRMGMPSKLIPVDALLKWHRYLSLTETKYQVASPRNSFKKSQLTLQSKHQTVAALPQIAGGPDNSGGGAGSCGSGSDGTGDSVFQVRYIGGVVATDTDCLQSIASFAEDYLQMHSLAQVQMPFFSSSSSSFSSSSSSSSSVQNTKSLLPEEYTSGGGGTPQDRARRILHLLLHNALLIGQIDNYQFGSVPSAPFTAVTGSELEVMHRGQHSIEQPFDTLRQLDLRIQQFLFEWGCVHSSLNACRCASAVFINRSSSIIQLDRVEVKQGRDIIVMGSPYIGYMPATRSLQPGGVVVIFVCAYPQSPLEASSLQACVRSAAFEANISSSLTETVCEEKGGFQVGFLEKSVTDWTAKYVLIIS